MLGVGKSFGFYGCWNLRANFITNKNEYLIYLFLHIEKSPLRKYIMKLGCKEEITMETLLSLIY